ncbi:MAG TPA: uracil-DNA glycosylase family protein [Haliangium sp.]|nr:uracil-DNA glycosylase family protein [Haliangium sp.]
MNEPDAREELGQLVRAFRQHLERQARTGARAVPAGLMPLPEVHGVPDMSDAPDAYDAPDAHPGHDEPAGRPSWPAPAFHQVERTPRPRPAAPVAHAALGPDAPMPSFTAALMAVLDEPAPARPAPVAAPRPRAQRLTLEDVRADLGDCQRCKLAGGRTNIVFGAGDPHASLMFVGEAPGADEDRRGEPFVGAAGQLLDRMIEAMGWSRDTVYIANVLKCRPPGNRDPQPDEVDACEPFLARQIEVIAPRIIVTLGRSATGLLLRSTAPVSSLRGSFQDYRGIRVMPTFHPAFLLRNPERKRDTWADLRLVIAELERLGIASPRPPKT